MQTARPRDPVAVDSAPRPTPPLGTASVPRTARVYMPALDGIRFLAFFLVFFHHSSVDGTNGELFAGAPLVLLRLRAFGWIGVDVFLCLSGFLIATLLLHEIQATGRLSVSRFYMRRILR